MTIENGLSVMEQERHWGQVSRQGNKENGKPVIVGQGQRGKRRDSWGEVV